MRNRGLSHKELTQVELARTLLAPDALGPMHNAFGVYKSLGESKAQTVIRRHDHTQVVRDQLKTMCSNLAQEIKQDEVQLRRDKKIRIEEQQKKIDQKLDSVKLRSQSIVVERPPKAISPSATSVHRVISTYASREDLTLDEKARGPLKLENVKFYRDPDTTRNFLENITRFKCDNEVNEYVVARSPERRNSQDPNLNIRQHKDQI